MLNTYLGKWYHKTVRLVNNNLLQGIIIAPQYKKQDNGKENVKMANIVVTMATLFMAACAGVRVL